MRCFQRQPVQKLHGDERLSVLPANVIDRADVGMAQCRCRLRLALKAGERQWVAGNFIGQELESNKTMKPDVLSFVDHAHPAATKLLNDAIVRYGLVDHEGEQDSARNLRVEQSRSQSCTMTWPLQESKRALHPVPNNDGSVKRLCPESLP
jgi:hypothetical protein